MKAQPNFTMPMCREDTIALANYFTFVTEEEEGKPAHLVIAVNILIT